MNRPAPKPIAPGLHVGQLRLVTDRALGSDGARAIGERFAGALDRALVAAGHVGTVHVGELSVEAPSHTLDDPAALARLAGDAARRILDRAPD